MSNCYLWKFLKVNSLKLVSDFKVKMYQIDFGWDFSPDPTGGAYNAPSNPLARIKGT